MLMCRMSHRVTCHIVSHVTTHCRYVSMGAAWVVALKQWLKKKWEEARDLWNLLFSDPTRARIIIATFAFVFVAAVITMVVLLQTQSFQSLPVPAPPPIPPPGRPCPWTLPCKRATDVVYTLAHSGAFECRGIVGGSSSSRLLYKCRDGEWMLQQDCSVLRSSDTRGNNLSYDNGGGYGGSGMVCSCVASCHLPTASCAFAGSVCRYPDSVYEPGEAAVFKQPDPAPLQAGVF